jgi:ergothioneine biosynthesis protein EgtB
MKTAIERSERAKLPLLAERYQRIRSFSEMLCETLEPEDCCIQSMPDASPIRWHLAHTTWFFETFVLARTAEYTASQTEYAYLFNSYYNAIGKQFPRERRGLLSRPTVEQVWEYRREIDRHMLDLLTNERRNPGIDLAPIVELGLHHEQQHQELMLTDIKHALACNPMYPIYRPGRFTQNSPPTDGWTRFPEGIYWIGHEGEGFAFDNESPRHRTFLESFAISNRLVTCGEYLEFIDDGGYRRPELWLSEGWRQASDQQWQTPLYWFEREGVRHEFTLNGVRPIDSAQPVCHVSYFEADAFARWAGARLPTEAEWEVASENVSIAANWADILMATGEAIHPSSNTVENAVPSQMFGTVWQWTASPYTPYPGYQAAAGALGEYNGKFMCNQFVLRGGSCATPSNHIRRTYRNFFSPGIRWQFAGIRLAK